MPTDPTIQDKLASLDSELSALRTRAEAINMEAQELLLRQQRGHKYINEPEPENIHQLFSDEQLLAALNRKELNDEQ